MRAADVIAQLEGMEETEVSTVASWLAARHERSPAFQAFIRAGLDDLRAGRSRTYGAEELAQKVRQWAGR